MAPEVNAMDDCTVEGSAHRNSTPTHSESLRKPGTDK